MTLLLKIGVVLFSFLFANLVTRLVSQGLTRRHCARYGHFASEEHRNQSFEMLFHRLGLGVVRDRCDD